MGVQEQARKIHRYLCRDSTTESRHTFSVRTKKKPLFNIKKSKAMPSIEKSHSSNCRRQSSNSNKKYQASKP